MKKKEILELKEKQTIGYLRVSTVEQDIKKNKADILLLANEKKLGNVTWIEEKISGKINWKQRKIGNVVDGLHKGDCLIVSELSRLGRSMLEIMEILSLLCEKEVKVFAVKGNWHLDGSIQSKIIAMIYSMCAEIERDLISSRTKEALRAKKAAGVKLGRPKGSGSSKLDKVRPEIEALMQNGSTQKFIANRYNTTEANLSLWLKKHKIRKGRQ